MTYVPLTLTLTLIPILLLRLSPNPSPSFNPHAYVLLLGLAEGAADTGDGLSAALLWVLDFAESEENAGDARPKYWAIRCLLDALVRFLSRFRLRSV